jgi:hypothetical protein
MKDDAAGGEANGSDEADELEATGGAAGAGAAMRSKFCHGRSEPPKDVLDCRRPLGVAFEPEGKRVGVYTGPTAAAGSTGRITGDALGDGSLTRSRGTLPGTERSDAVAGGPEGRREGVAIVCPCSVWMLASETLRGGATGRHDGAVLDSPLGPALPPGVKDEAEGSRGLLELVRRSAAADSFAMIDRRSSGAAEPSVDFCQGCSRVGGGDPSGMKLACDGEPFGGAREDRRRPRIG